MNRKLKWLSGLVLSGSLLTAHATPDAGWINNFDEGAPDNYTLTRGDKTMSVAFLKVLKVGDKIAVKGQQTIDLRLRGGTTPLVAITTANSPFQVDNANQVPNEFGESWTWIKTHLDKWRKLTQSVPKDDSTDLQIPLLKKVKAPLVLVAGKRALALQWYGGTPPYQVTVKRGRNRLQSTSTQKTAIKTKVINFEANKSYRVVVEDAQEQRFSKKFKVVSKAPSYPEVLQNVPNDIRAVLRATWLIYEEKGQWILEAYQQLDTSQPAKKLKTALIRGMGKRAYPGKQGRGPSPQVDVEVANDGMQY